MQTERQKSSLAAGFVASIRECMPDTAPVRETLAFTRLVLEHPTPPGGLTLLHRSLWNLINIAADVPRVVAMEMRRIGDGALSVCNHSTSGQVLEMAMHTLSLRFDDRPAPRMLSVDLGMMAAGMSVVSVDDVIPSWKPQTPAACLMSPGPVHDWVDMHVAQVCGSLRSRIGHPEAFKGWSPSDVECALLALRMNYCVFRAAMDGARLETSELVMDFDLNGMPVWDALQEALEELPQVVVSSRSLRDPSWHVTARHGVRRAIGSAAEPAPQSVTPRPEVNLHSIPSARAPVVSLPILNGRPSLVVCRTPIVDAADRYDKEEVARHRILEHPLPLTVMPHSDDVEWNQQQLTAEFPWARDVLAVMFDDLLGRAKLGIQTLAFPPTLLVGPPGSGKSRLAGRLADVFGVPRMDLSLGGTSDSKVLGGTARGWGSGKPSDLATFLAIRKSASALVLLDELDKAAEGYRTGVGLQSYLLGFMEPETARRLMDVFLKTECDFSGVMWIGTANTLSGIQASLLSRMRVLMLRQPSAEHFRVIAENVLMDTAKSWTLERDVLPALTELDLPWHRLGSARQVRRATEAAVMQWARKLQRH